MVNIKFSEWLLIVENQTIVQLLRGDQQLKNNEDYAKIRQNIENKIIKRLGAADKNKDVYTNYFTFNFWKIWKDSPKKWGWSLNQKLGEFYQKIDQTIDYLIANKDNGPLKSKLNNSEFTIDMLIDESEDWHEKIQVSKAKPAAEADTFIDLKQLGSVWHGWRWVLLDRKYCKQEGESAGHCGNASGKEGDNILSLRDPSNVAHLTFIINNGIIGEAKGRNNSKPAPKYHQAIIELLKNNIVKTIQGGGYKPENNFKMNDLDESVRDNLYRMKPSLNYDLYIESFFNKEIFSLGNPKKILEKLEEMFDDSFQKVEKQQLIVDEYNSFKEFSESANRYYSGKIDDLSFMDDFQFDHFRIDLKDIFDYISDDNIEKITEILEAEKIKYDEDDIVSAIEDFDEIRSAVESAAYIGYETGTYDDAWKSINRSLSEQDEYGFYVEIKNMEEIHVLIDISRLKDVYKEHKKDNVELRELINIEYSAPYYGYEGFSKNSFNENLSEELTRLKNQYV